MNLLSLTGGATDMATGVMGVPALVASRRELAPCLDLMAASAFLVSAGAEDSHMGSAMISDTAKQGQILDDVVQFVPVTVVDRFSLTEWPAKMLLHDIAVLKGAFPVASNADIAVAVAPNRTALPALVLRSFTESLTAGPRAEPPGSTGRRVKGASTVIACLVHSDCLQEALYYA